MKWMTDPNGPLVILLNRITNLILLNLCFLLCCIPLVTIGASCSAMYAVFLRKKEDEGVIRSFFMAFRDSFKKATISWIILLAIGGVLILDYWFLGILGEGTALVKYILLFCAFSLLAVISYTFPLISRFEDSVLRTLKNAFLLSFSMLPKTLLIMAVNLAPLLFLLWDVELFGRSLVLWLLLGFAGLAKINSYIIEPIFQQISVDTEDA